MYNAQLSIIIILLKTFPRPQDQKYKKFPRGFPPIPFRMMLLVSGPIENEQANTKRNLWGNIGRFML